MNLLVGIPYEAFFAIYLIIACNFLGDLLGCKFKQMLQENMYVKHFFGYLTLAFLVVLTGVDINNEENLIKAVIYSFILYFWFVCTTKTHIYTTIIVLLIFFIMYILSIRIKILEKNIETDKNIEEIKKLRLASFLLLIIAFVITFFGILYYLMLKKRELSTRTEKFSYITFFIGKQICRND